MFVASLLGSLTVLLLVGAPVRPEPAVGPTIVLQHAGLLGQPVPDGKAQIVFYRPSSIRGALMGCNVFAGSQKIAGLSANRYRLHDVEPGLHTFAASASGRAPFQMQLREGDRRYVKCDFGGGLIARHASLQNVSDEVFAKVAEKLRPMD